MPKFFSGSDLVFFSGSDLVFFAGGGVVTCRAHLLAFSQHNDITVIHI